MNDKNIFGDFGGTAVGESEVAKWEYPGIGYNASAGIFYVDEDQVDSLTLNPLALRQCKEVEAFNGMMHRYPVKTAKAQMVDGDVTYRLQVACIHNGEIYIFGARSWTARASWLNPRGGQWRDDNFDTGVWFQLEDHIKEMRATHEVSTTPLCWELSLKVGKERTVGSGKNTSKAKSIALDGGFTFVGAETVTKNETLFVDEDLTGWVNEWKQTSQTAAEVEEAEPVYEETPDDAIPF